MQERFLFISSSYHDRATPDEIKTWLIMTANESMAITGQFSNVLGKVDGMGPFKKAHVQIVINVSYSVFCILTFYVWFLLGIQLGLRVCSNRLPLSSKAFV